MKTRLGTCWDYWHNHWDNVFNPDMRPMKFVRAGYKVSHSKESPDKQAFRCTSLADFGGPREAAEIAGPYFNDKLPSGYDNFLKTEVNSNVVVISKFRGKETSRLPTKEKWKKFQELLGEFREWSWQGTCELTEVGAGGFIGRSLCKTVSKLGQYWFEKVTGYLNDNEKTRRCHPLVMD